MGPNSNNLSIKTLASNKWQRIFLKLNHPLLPTVLFACLLLVVFYDAPSAWPYSALETLGWFGIGVFFWTFLEYSFHRFLAHLSNNPKGWQTFFSGSHNKHHQNPASRFLLILNPVLSLGLWFLFFGLFAALLPNMVAAKTLMSGVAAGYIFYEWVHYGSHYYQWKSRLGLYYRKLHHYHHFKSSSQAFGVTSPLWDYVFGTQRS